MVLPADPSPREWLYVCGPSEAMTQIDLVAGPRGIRDDVHPSHQSNYNHSRLFLSGVPRAVRQTANLLKDVLTMTSREHLDFALALDWYKVPDPEVDPNRWANTSSGELVNRAKYRSHSPSGRELADHMADLIERHPLLEAANSIITVPGHRADGTSFGEKLARAVAHRADKPVVETQCPNGPRPQQKEESARNLLDEFEIPDILSGGVIIVDDVYRTGGSMDSVAAAAKEAGARRVFGLAAVRTLRR